VLRVALKGILARKFRLVSTAFAVLLGVAFLSGTFVFTDTIQKAFDELFADAFQNTDSFVRSSETGEDPFGNELHPRIEDSAIALVAGVDGVADAQGSVTDFALVIGADGDPIGNPNNGPPTFGDTWLTGDLSPWTLTEGSREPGPGELVLDVRTADDGDLELGDMVTVITTSAPQEFPLVGTARFAGADSPGGASFAMFDLATAQTLFDAEGMVDAVLATASDGLSQEELTARIQAELPAGLEALTGQEITDENTDAIERGLSFLTIFLNVFAGISLFVGMFVIYNTFAITIAQRTRETAMLRAIGAGRGQVLGALMLEALVIGVVASILGLVGGILLATGLHQLLEAFDIDIPSAGTVIRQRTVIVSLIVGTVVTVLSAVAPAIKGSRVPPLAALREVALDRSARSKGRLVIGVALTALGVLCLVSGVQGEVALVGLGAALLFIGMFVLGPLFAQPVARVVGAPIAATGMAGVLARENARRNPRRTSRTAAALMIGVALVIAIAVIAASVKQSIRDALDDQFVGDIALDSGSQGFGGLSPELVTEVTALPEVAVATGLRFESGGAVAGSDATIVAIDPGPADEVFDFQMVEGAITDLTDDGIGMTDAEAEDLDVHVGDTVSVDLLGLSTLELTVQAIYDRDTLAGRAPYAITQSLSATTSTSEFDATVYVVLAEGVSIDEGKAALQPIVDRYPNADMEDRQEYIESQAATVDGFVNFIYGLLAFAVIIALFGIANTLMLSVHERTRELGLLRAVGSSRRQIRTMVRWESVIIAWLGTLLGLVIGVVLAYSLVKALEDDGIQTFKLPVVTVIVVVVLAGLFAVFAARRPAKRAAKLDILRAIAHE
jgi:putative ABC transport system permease protein